MPVVHGCTANWCKVRTHATPRQRTDGRWRVRRSERCSADLGNAQAPFGCHDGQRIQIGGFPLIRAHAQRGVTLEMLDRLIAFQMGQIDVVHGHVALKIHERFVDRLVFCDWAHRRKAQRGVHAGWTCWS